MKNKYDKVFKEFKAELEKSGVIQALIDEVIRVLETNKSFLNFLYKELHWPCKQIVKVTLENKSFILNGDLIDEKNSSGSQMGE